MTNVTTYITYVEGDIKRSRVETMAIVLPFGSGSKPGPLRPVRVSHFQWWIGRFRPNPRP
jgi:hypothetical protein